jgi:transposase InsO family protein
MKKANSNFTIHELCLLFKLSESTYYAHIRPKSANQQERHLITAIKAIAIDVRHTYGRRRIHASLIHQGFKLRLYRTARLMVKAQVSAIKPKRKHYYAKSGKPHLATPNHLNREFNPPTAKTHWVGDITYIRTHQGWRYLASVLDLATKEIVGWAISKRPNAELAKDALSHAIRRQQPVLNQLMFHSEQGVQYSAKLFVNYLAILTVTQSMSRRGNCWDTQFILPLNVQPNLTRAGIG